MCDDAGVHQDLTHPLVARTVAGHVRVHEELTKEREEKETLSCKSTHEFPSFFLEAISKRLSRVRGLNT